MGVGAATLAVVVASTALLTACADPTGRPRADPTTTSAAPVSERQLVTSNGEPVVQCGPSGLPFTPSAYLGSPGHRSADPEIIQALERLVADNRVDAPPALRGVAVQDAPWFVLNRTADRVEIGTGTWTADGPAGDAMTVDLRWRDGRWWPGWGGCNLARVPPPGYDWVRVSRAEQAPDPTSRSVPVIVSPPMCTGGQDPVGFLREPLVVEHDTSVLVYWTATPSHAPTGADGACAGGGLAVPSRIMLSRPLGERTVLDGSRWPPARLTDP